MSVGGSISVEACLAASENASAEGVAPRSRSSAPCARSATGTGVRDPSLADRAVDELDPDRDRDEREIVVPARDLLKRPAPRAARARKARFDDQLVGPPGCHVRRQ